MTADGGRTKKRGRLLKEGIKTCLDALCDLYRVEVSTMVMEIWERALSDIKPRVLIAGFELCSKKQQFMPTPAEFRRYCEEAAASMYLEESSHWNCRVCLGTGWKLVPGQDSGQVATRCDGKGDPPRNVSDEVRKIARELYKGYDQLEAEKDCNEISRVSRKANIVRLLRQGIEPKWISEAEVEEARKHV